MTLENITITKLIPAEYNPRIITKEEFEGLKTSIETFGLVDPIVVNKDMTIIGGHQRLRAVQALGHKVVPCIVLDLNKHDEKKLNVILNSQAISGKYDENLLMEILEELKLDDDYHDLRLDKLEPLDLSIAEVEEDDFDPTPPAEPITILGDLYELNEHRLHCADSTSIDAVEKLMNGKKADMVFTDPPYRMEAQGGSNQLVGKAAKKLGERIKDLCDFDPEAFLQCLPTVFNKGIMNSYIFCNKDLIPDYLNYAVECGYSFNILIWKRPAAIPIGGSHRPDIEYLLLFRKNALWNNAIPNANYSRCLEYGRDNSTSHPTMKPLQLIADEVKISSNQSSLVFDFFLGSGSTLIACEQTSRICYGQELDPKYCDVIVKRYIKYMTEKGKPFTIKLNGEIIDPDNFEEKQLDNDE